MRRSQQDLLKNAEEEVVLADTLKQKIKGILYDAVRKKPMAAHLTLVHKGNSSTTSTDQGYFEFVVLKRDLKDSMILKVNVVGCEEAYVKIYRNNLTNIKLYVKIEADESEVMGKMINPYPVLIKKK